MLAAVGGRALDAVASLASDGSHGSTRIAALQDRQYLSLPASAATA